MDNILLFYNTLVSLKFFKNKYILKYEDKYKYQGKEMFKMTET